METIVAVVVTYNRLDLLRECIKALRSQSRPLDSIYVINNDSTDGTKDWLEDQQGLNCIHQTNGGGAHGFYTGMKAAYFEGFDWIWLMDDDVEPHSDCLAQMLKANEVSNNYFHVLQPDRRFWNSNAEWRYGTKFNFSNPFRQEAIQHVRSSDLPNHAIKEIVSFPFEGPMIAREVLKNVGFADKRYFIWYDDTDYSARVHFAGFKIGLVPQAVMIKKINPAVDGIVINWKSYYQIRNQIILDRKFAPTRVIILRAAYFNSRRILAVIKKSFRKRKVSGLFTEVKEILRATVDGFRFKLNEV